MPTDDPTRSLQPDPVTHSFAEPDLTATRPASDDEQAKSAERSTGVPTVAGYALHEQLGEGGMGTVYKATQLKLNRTVALKLIHGGVTAAARERIRFLAEAEAVASLDHPHVVRVYDFGDAGGSPYLAMEYLPGGTLSARLTEHRKLKTEHDSIRSTVTLVKKIALAVQSAHDGQIVHRDLKPSNILFDAAGEPRITDFGLAKRASGGDLTATNAIMGTAAYMAPEQAKGESKFVGPAADIWALGVILYECLTGKRPFGGSNDYDIIKNVIEAEPSTIRSVNRLIPQELDLIVRKCLAKSPADRYASAAKLAEDLDCWLQGKPVSVKAAGSVERVLKWTKRNKLAAGIMAASVMAMLAMTGLAVWAFDREEAATRSATQAAEAVAKYETLYGDFNQMQSRLTNVQNQEAAALARKREIEAYSLRFQDCQRIYQANIDFDRNAVALARQSLAAVETPDLRNSLAFKLTQRYCEGSDWTLRGHTSGVKSVAFSPDGKTLATGSDDYTARLWDAVTGQTLREFKGHTDSVYSVAFSPDGKTLATGSGDKTARLWDAATGQTLREFKGHTRSVTSVAFSPDGKTLATGSWDNTARLWDAATGQTLREFKGHTSDVYSVAFSPDGQTLATGSADKTARLWDAATGQTLREFKGHTDSVRCVAFSPDGKTLATGSYDNTARLWDAATGQTLREFKGHASFVTSVAFSPDGKTLATGSWDNTARLWDAASGQTLREFKGLTSLVSSVAFSPDGQTLATGSWDNTARLWDAATGQTLREFKGHTDSVRCVAFSPDGKTLATGSADKTARLWDAATGQTLREFKGHTSSVSSVAFSPDGQTLATGSYDNTARLWDAATGQTLREFKGHTSSVTSIAFSPDGKTLATGSSDKTARLWDAATGQTLREFKGHTSSVTSIAFSPDGKTLATGSDDNTARLWDAATGQTLREFKGHTNDVNNVAFSLDGKTLATGSSDKTARLWDATTGQTLREFKGHTNTVASIAFSPDGKMLATGSWDNTARLWDAATGQTLREFKGHTISVTSVAFSPDGQTLATGSGDNTARIWDAATGQTLREFKGHTNRVTSVAFSPDGNRIVTKARVDDPNDAKKEIDEVIVWDTRTGERLKDVPIPETVDTPPPDDGFYYIPDGNVILKVSKTVPREEVARRQRILAPKPEYHREKADLYEATDPFAAAFHLRRLAQLEPDNADVKARLAAVVAKLNAAAKPRETAPPPRVKE